MKSLKLVGIGGTDGSGKDTVAQMLVERHGWLYVSVTDMLRDELRKQNRTLSRENLRTLSAQWRREFGKAVLIDKALQKFGSRESHSELGGLAIASLRHPVEADRVHELGGKVVWTDGDPHIRYKRIVARDRGSEDQVTFKEFLVEDRAQMHQKGDEATVSLAGVKERADIFVNNDGNDIKAFKDAAEKALDLH